MLPFASLVKSCMQEEEKEEMSKTSDFHWKCVQLQEDAGDVVQGAFFRHKVGPLLQYYNLVLQLRALIHIKQEKMATSAEDRRTETLSVVCF